MKRGSVVCSRAMAAGDCGDCRKGSTGGSTDRRKAPTEKVATRCVRGRGEKAKKNMSIQKRGPLLQAQAMQFFLPARGGLATG